MVFCVPVPGLDRPAAVRAAVQRCQDGFDSPDLSTYFVHMKHVTPTEARRNWFRLLDEIAGREVVVLERNGRRIVLRCEDDEGAAPAIPDYGALLQVPDAEEADRWGWGWTGPEQELRPTIRQPGR